MTRAVDDMLKAESLPLGHYGRKHALRAVDKEYAACREIERKWRRHFDVYIEFDVALAIIQNLCKALYLKPPILLYDATKRFPCYCNKRIYLPYPTQQTTTIVHELAHHVVYIERLRGGHNGDFLWVEELLFQTLSENKGFGLV